MDPDASIGSGAFYSNQLTSLTIPDNVSIESRAFEGNDLQTITIGTGVTLGDYLLTHDPANNLFREAYSVGGAGNYTGTQTGEWVKD